MKSTLGRAVATAILLALPTSMVTIVAAPAEATPGCVTRKEFRHAKKGHALGRVHRSFDTSGVRFYYDGGPPAWQSRAYDRCSGGQAAVYYEKRRGVWRLIGKSWAA